MSAIPATSSPTVLPFNPALARLPVYQPGRPIEEVARELKIDPAHIAKLASNENPLGPSPKAVAALRQVADQVHWYPDGNAFHLKERLAARLGVKPSNLILGNGSNEIIEFVGHALVGPGAEVVISQYCFAIYPIVTLLFGGQPVVVPARDYGHDLAAMSAAVTPQTRVVFVANPNNPTGTLAERAALLQLIDRVPAEVLLVIDEAYIDYLADPVDLLPIIRSGERPNLVLLRTFSKIYGLAGLRLGYGIGHPAVIAAWERVRQPFNVNAAAQAAALAALGDDEHVERSRAVNRAGLIFWEGALRELGLEFVPSSANFVLVRVGEGAGVFGELQRRGIIVRPMAGYALPEWIRISVGTEPENTRCRAELRAVLGR